MRSAARVAIGSLAALLLAALLAACGDAVMPPTAAPPTAAPSPSAAPTVPAESPGASSAPASTAPSPASPSFPSAAGAVEDRSLLSVLPASIGGASVMAEDGQFDAAMQDPAFAASTKRAAFGTFAVGDSFVSSSIVEPVPGSYSDRWYQDWRETYDQGACGQAGGVARNAQAEMGGRTVYITTCVEALRVYHTWIQERSLLVEAFSWGSQNLGELLMEGLRP